MTDAEMKSMKSITDRIAELEATPRALVGTDEGTHAKPANHYVRALRYAEFRRVERDIHHGGGGRRDDRRPHSPRGRESE